VESPNLKLRGRPQLMGVCHPQNIQTKTKKVLIAAWGRHLLHSFFASDHI
jgi:hypothetical protein